MNPAPSTATLPAAPHVQPVGKAHYAVSLASSTTLLQAAQALRFEVFNVELDEGLAEAWDTGLDTDPYDAVCDHLVVEDLNQGTVVGTYRLLTGVRAQQTLGYYSAREFDFAPFEPMRSQIAELGRACIHREHRNFSVLNLLWKGIGIYARERGARYLLGCSSLTSQDAAVGAAAWESMAPQRAPAEWSTRPWPEVACPLGLLAKPAPRIPRLLAGYLSVGARICAPPAIDREFRTIDFLTWLDIDSPALLALQQRGRFVI